MKKQEYYYPSCIMSKPFEEDYKKIKNFHIIKL